MQQLTDDEVKEIIRTRLREAGEEPSAYDVTYMMCRVHSESDYWGFLKAAGWTPYVHMRDMPDSLFWGIARDGLKPVSPWCRYE